MKTLYTGGAHGSDLIFELVAKRNKFKIFSYSFPSHNTKSSNSIILTPNQLKEGFKHIQKANLTLNRNLNQTSSYVKNLFCRNYFQIKNTEAVFVIGNLQTENQVFGGTGWAVQMAIDNNKPVYLFEQNDNQWYYYDYETDKFEIYEEIPTLTERFTGIGTRRITDNGIKAIESLFNKKEKI